MNYLEEVKKFHQLFDHPVLEEPTIPNEGRRQLRINLLEEEVKELKHALEDGNIVEMADALCDIQYVLSGAILECGLAEKFPALFAEVQRSNMSKACATLAEAEHTKAHHEAKGGDICHIVPKGNVYLVYRTRDMKTMKSINYSPANLQSIL